MRTVTEYILERAPLIWVAFLALFVVAACSGKNHCNSPDQLLWGQVCRDLGFNFSKTKLGNFSAACGGSGKKPVISCSPGSGTLGACDGNSSDSAGFYIVLLPNNNGGSYLDTNGQVYNNCNDVWTGLYLGGKAPSGIVGIYLSDLSVSNQKVTCNGAGCTASPTTCFAAWDNNSNRVLATPATIPASSTLACAFIDSPSGSGPPPISGRIATSDSNNFYIFTPGGGGTITLNSWTDY